MAEADQQRHGRVRPGGAEPAAAPPRRVSFLLASPPETRGDPAMTDGRKRGRGRNREPQAPPAPTKRARAEEKLGDFLTAQTQHVLWRGAGRLHRMRSWLRIFSASDDTLEIFLEENPPETCKYRVYTSRDEPVVARAISLAFSQEATFAVFDHVEGGAILVHAIPLHERVERLERENEGLRSDIMLLQSRLDEVRRVLFKEIL